MKMMTALAVVAAAGFAASANAVTVLSDGFETGTGWPAGNANPFGTNNYGNPAGNLGPNNWYYQSSGPSSAAGVASAATAVFNDPAGAHSGNQYLRINAGNAAFNIATSSSKVAQIYRDDTVAPTPSNPVLKVGVWVYQEGAGYANRTTGSGLYVWNASFTEIIAQITMQSNGVYGIFGAAQFNGTSFTTPPSVGLSGAVSDTWTHLEIQLDYTTNTIAWLINGIDQTSIVTGAGVSNSFLSTDGYGESDLFTAKFSSTAAGATTTGGNAWRFDDWSVDANAAVPAPASLALVGLGGLVAARRRRA